MKHLYITAIEPKSGKSAIVLGMMQLLLRHVRSVAFFRPIIAAPLFEGAKDHDINLIISHFGLKTPYEDSYGFTLLEARNLIGSGQKEQLLDGIIEKYKKLAAEHDFILYEGTDFMGKDAAFEFDLNVDIAAALGSPVLFISNAAGKGPQEIIESTQATLDLLDSHAIDVMACFVNRSSVTEVEEMQITAALRSRESSANPLLTFVIPDEPLLGRPTMKDVKNWLDGEVLYGEERLDSLVDGFLIAAMHVGNFLEYVEQGQVIVTPGDRMDIVIAALASHYSRSYDNIAGVVLTGGFKLPHSIRRLFEGWNMPLPVISVPTNTSLSVEAISRLYGKIEPDDIRKISTALGHFEECVDTHTLMSRIGSAKPGKTSPKMFEYNLLELAASNRMRIVLPEGAEERILRAADVLMRRKVADIILLGDMAVISRKIAEFGLALDVPVIQPELSPQFDEYVEAYYEARKAKGISLEQARDIMKDSTYYATMMVKKGAAEGMVSGSINTTAHTIRPALEFVKTKPGTSIVSSVFLMCMKDRVLVFGDCAVNPNPTADQLASIAISSAHTASVFGIEPRVAMLSYSTGASGKGADVELVIDATRIAHERAPELLLEGPIQYDAAIDVGVAKTKMPDSKVAGHATVFIFPDLNTGNNTYKAVQRAADAVAIGPVLQGLNKPVNDLSRGCTVPDIVNTVAITAIQAQAEHKK